MNNQNSLDELKRKVYFYGDLCAHFQGECEFGKASVDKRNSNIREAGDELLAAINKTIMEARMDELIEMRHYYRTVVPPKLSVAQYMHNRIGELRQQLIKKYGRADNAK